MRPVLAPLLRGRARLASRAALAGLALVGGAGLALVLSGAGAGEIREPSTPDPTPRAVALETVELTPLRSRVVVPGVVESRSRIQLAFEVAGRVAEVAVREGDRVEADGLIARLDLTDLDRELELARAALARTRARAREAHAILVRQRGLLEARSISAQAFDRASVRSDVAAAEVREAVLRAERAATRCAKATLSAPVTGHVERRLVEPHEYVAAGTPAIVLTELDPVRVRAAVPDRHARLLVPGARARVWSPAWPDAELTGRIAQVDVAADPETRTWPFEVEIANPDLRLRVEAAVEVTLESDTPALVVAVPLAAALRDAEQRPFAFVAREGSAGLRAERRPLELGAAIEGRVVVARGLEPGDRVVVRGQHYVHDGDALRSVAGAP